MPRLAVAALLVGASLPAAAGKIDRTRDAAREKAGRATGPGDDDDSADACGSCLGSACEVGVEVLQSPPAGEPGEALPDDALPTRAPPPDPPPYVIEEGRPPPAVEEAPGPYRVVPVPAPDGGPDVEGPTLLLGGAWVLADETLLGLRGRFSVPLAPGGFGLHGGWEGFHERTPDGWDALGLPSLGLFLGSRDKDVEGLVRLQAEGLWLGRGDWIFGGAIGLEGGARAAGPLWLRVEAGNAYEQ